MHESEVNLRDREIKWPPTRSVPYAFAQAAQHKHKIRLENDVLFSNDTGILGKRNSELDVRSPIVDRDK